MPSTLVYNDAFLESIVDCDFEPAFQCGYSSTVLGSLSWSRTNSESQLRTSTGPTLDSEGSTTGRLIGAVGLHTE